jgi:Tol biopolymer transport system component
MGLIYSRSARFSLVAGMLVFLAGCTSNNGLNDLNPTPSISALSPSFATANGLSSSACSSGPITTVFLTGAGFIATSQAAWNGSNRTTALNVETNQLSVILLACDLTAPGVGQITVLNPPPGGGPTANGALFHINAADNPVPAIGTITPSSTPVGTVPAGGVLVVDAPSGDPAVFNSTSVVAFNGVAQPTTLVSPSELDVQITSSEVATAASINVTVTNPSPGGGVSAPTVFTVGSSGAARGLFPQVVSVAALGGPANGASAAPAASADGRYVAFYSQAKNLVPQGASGNIFLRDTCLGAVSSCAPQTWAVDLAADGSAPDGLAGNHVSLSANGRFVAFVSSASNLTSGIASEAGLGGMPADSHVFVRDMCVGTAASASCKPQTALLSIDAKGNPVHGLSPSVSGDGRFVAFVSWNRNVAAGSPEGIPEVFVRDTCAGSSASIGCVAKTTRVPMDSQDQTGWAGGAKPAISSDGRYIAFEGWSPRFAAGDGSVRTRIFLRDTCLGADAPVGCIPATNDVSISQNGAPLSGMNMFPAISGRGRFVTFVTQAAGAGASSDESAVPQQLLLRDTCLGPTAAESCVPSTTVISGGSAAIPGYPSAFSPWISASGRYITFVGGASETSNSGAAPHEGYVFVHDTCFGAAADCTARTNLVAAPGAASQGTSLGVYKFSSVPLSSDGRFAVFFSPYAVPASPASGFGDVYLTTTSN